MSETEYTPIQTERISERAGKFLGAVSTVPPIRAILDLGGYTEEEHQRGWNLWLDLLGYKRSPDTTSDVTKIRQREAMATLDQWDGPSFDRTRAALEHRYPAQAAYVFDGLSAKTGVESVGAVRTYLDRVAALRDGTDPARTETRTDDHAAWQLLVARRIVDAAEEASLRELIAEATKLADMPAPVQPDPNARHQTARALDAWLRDWRETARVLVTRRDYQIRLGLAERRSSKEEAAEMVEAI
jgi:hypothetical protein